MTAVPSGWDVVDLPDVVEILDRHRVPVNREERAERQGDIPYYGATGQVGWIDDYLFDEELILLGEDGAPFLDGGKPVAYMIRGKSWVNNHAHVLRPKDNVDPRFLLHQLNQVDYRPFVSGTTRLKLTQGRMREIPISLPPKPIQREIADTVDVHLSRLNAGEGNLRHVLGNLGRYRASVLQAACEGRLVPTEAELAGREGWDYEPAEALLDRILAERRARWEAEELEKLKAKGKEPKDDRWKEKYKEPEGPDTSELRELPEGWVWASVLQLSHSVDYGSSKKTTRDDAGVPVLRMGNIVEGQLALDDLKYLPSDHDEFPKLILDAGDLLFNRTNSAELVGKTAVYHGTPTPCSFASYLLRVRFVDGVEPRFVASFINSPLGRRWASTVVSQQVGQANINATKLKALAIPLPPRRAQIRIVNRMEELLSRAEAVTRDTVQAKDQAASLRSSILGVAFRGELS